MTEGNTSQLIGASRSIYYSLTEEVPGLTDEEKDKLETVMQKALEFEAEESKKMRQPLEGQLYKYTNVMKGWQYRWFIIMPDTGMLEYYMLDEKRKSRPRGALCLSGAVVSPNEEDNQSFSISSTCGEVYKLKASDAKERQIWVDKLRAVIEHLSKNSLEISKGDPALGFQSSFTFCKSTSSIVSEDNQSPRLYSESSALLAEKEDSEKQVDFISDIKESVYKAAKCQKTLAKSIEELPLSGPHVKCSDHNLLLIKAISQASIQSLEQCYLILRRQKQKTRP